MPRRPVLGDEVRAALRAEITEILVSRAPISNPTITYTQLAEQIQTVPLAAQSAELAVALVAISAVEEAAGRGMLSALVIHSSGDKLPGAGFFAQAADFGRDITNRRTCWRAELARVCAYWMTQQP